MPDPTADFDRETARRLHETLIARLTREGHLGDPLIAAAFRAVPRHHFLPGHPLEQIYADQAIAIKREGEEWISSSSQPAMMAIMLAQLDLKPGMSVLEIGTGTGYNAALLAHIVGPEGRVVSIDIDADLIHSAAVQLKAAGFPQIELRHGDGAEGAPDAAPFDRIIVTVGAWDLLPAWRAQLASRGRIVVPITVLPGLMLSLALERRGEVWKAVSSRPCGFVLLRGQEAHPDQGPGSLRIVLHPRSIRAAAVGTAATIEKSWSRIEIVWGEDA